MTAPQAPLAPPPPLASLNEDQSRSAAGLDSPPLQTEENRLNGADVLAGLNQNAPPDEYWEDEVPHEEAAATSDAASEATPEADSKPKKYDFFGHVHDIAYSANAEKTSPDFKAMEKEMVDKNLLPVFAISESFSPPPLFALNSGQDRTQKSLNHYRDKYFELKAQA